MSIARKRCWSRSEQRDPLKEEGRHARLSRFLPLVPHRLSKLRSAQLPATDDSRQKHGAGYRPHQDPEKLVHGVQIEILRCVGIVQHVDGDLHRQYSKRLDTRQEVHSSRQTQPSRQHQLPTEPASGTQYVEPL